MKKFAIGVVAITLSASLSAQEEPAAAPSPGEIVAAAVPSEWVAIPAGDLLVMDLAPDRDGNPRRVVIQLMPAPFSQGWVENIKLLARSHWYDGISVNRVQDNYVVQWGDPNYDNPEAEGETKPLPEGLKVVDESGYRVYGDDVFGKEQTQAGYLKVKAYTRIAAISAGYESEFAASLSKDNMPEGAILGDQYAQISSVIDGWAIAAKDGFFWPTHCYGMVGVGRNYSPDTGSGAELYTVIGHAPRHLDRNIALIGRIIEGMEHLSSLPRGKGVLGFYGEGELDKRTPILSVRVGSDLEEFPQPVFEYLSTESESFAQYAEARANRRDPFFIHPAGGADICNIPVPVRRVPGE